MSDSFGRHKSTRWANASVPSYGEEWDGDDYDYDYGSNDDKSHSSEPAVDAQDPSPNSDLVLSIDQIHREEDSDLGSDSDVSLETPKLSLTSLPRGSDSDFDFHGKPSVAPIDTSRNPEKTETEKIVHGEDDIPAQHVVSTRAIDDVMVPPTPTFSTHKEPDTPRSESSFQSDADSIQYEPKDLNIRGPEKEIDVTGDAYENEHQSRSSTESAAQDSALSSSQTESEHLVLSSPVTASHTEPLVLTIDREQSSTDSDTSTIEDVDERNTHDQRSSRDINEDDDNPLDSLIYDLQSATTNDKGHLPTLDSLQDIKLPDFENTSFGHLKEYEVESPSTPTAPLDMSRSHQEYVKAQTPRKSSVRKAPRTELMSVDYSNIADAVSGYMSDGRPESLRKELFVNPIVEDDSSPEADEEHDQSDLESRDLHPVVSSGSLSTGKLSLASSIQPSKNESKEDVSRRVSTSTINMGGWKPNTNNYRDQFINDIDNESVVNFNAQGNDGYRQFTNLRNSLGGSGFDSVAETQSNASSLSIPETIDAALPSIQEDDDHDSSFGKSTEEAAPEESSTFESHSTFDTVFKPHDHVQNFKELLTPTSSSAELPREKQRYSSLLGDSSTLDDASTRKPSTEIVDSESDATVAAVGSPVSEPSTVIRKKSLQKPLYNWNNIISKSQPIDRIALFKEALKKENEYDSGLREWLQEALKQVENSPNMHIGKIASQAYQNAPHNELRRHTSLRSKVSSVRDKVETSGLQASTLGKRFLNRGKKLMKG